VIGAERVVAPADVAVYQHHDGKIEYDRSTVLEDGVRYERGTLVVSSVRGNDAVFLIWLARAMQWQGWKSM
jgi:hypothetical protein